MKIVVLSTNPKLYSTSRLLEAGKERGHKMVVLNHRRCYMNITTMRPSIHYKGESVEGVDAIIPRIGASVSFYGAAVVRQFEMMGVYSVNESVAITRSRDKLRALQLLAEMRPLVDGTYIMPSFGRYEQSAELVRRVRAEIAGAADAEPAAAGRGA